MEIIFITGCKNHLEKKGERVKINDGYARNFCASKEAWN